LNANGSSAARKVVLARLMSESADGDWKAFTRLYAMTSPQLYGVMLRMTNYAQACEDLLQEVYITVWKRARRYDVNKAQVMTWLIAIARNRTLDWLRSQGAGMNQRLVDQDPEALDLAAGTATPEQSAQNAASETALENCLDTLSDEQRNAVVLAYLEGHSHAELAERLSSPLGTVKSWVRRGLDRLKTCLQGLGGAS
jgi:RNA polymerase sigma-70 factor (ECF subfamily)